VSEQTKYSNLPDIGRNTPVQLLALYTNPENQSVTDRQTDGRQDDANSRSHCEAVRSGKTVKLTPELVGLFLEMVIRNILLAFAMASSSLSFSYSCHRNSETTS